MTGHFSLRNEPITVWFRWDCTSSGGVKAIHWFSETSWKRGLLNISKMQRCITSILDVVSHRKRDIADISWLVVKCAWFPFWRKYSHPSGSLYEILPFIRFEMSMHLMHAAGFNFYKSSRNVSCDWKVGWIDYANRATTGLQRFLVQ